MSDKCRCSGPILIVKFTYDASVWRIWMKDTTTTKTQRLVFDTFSTQSPKLTCWSKNSHELTVVVDEAHDGDTTQGRCKDRGQKLKWRQRIHGVETIAFVGETIRLDGWINQQIQTHLIDRDQHKNYQEETESLGHQIFFLSQPSSSRANRFSVKSVVHRHDY